VFGKFSHSGRVTSKLSTCITVIDDSCKTGSAYTGHVELAPPTLGTWSMAGLLGQPLEYYFYYYHHCTNCGAHVDTLGTHGLSCQFSRGRQPRHASLNDIIKRTLEVAKVPCHLEPSGLLCSDGKRPDGTTLVPWQCGKVLVWDATCPDTLAPSHSALATREAGAVAADAEHKKNQKYTHLLPSYHFVPIAVETLGVFGKATHSLFKEITRRVKSITEDDMAHQHFVQRISVAVQRGNAASVLGCALVRGEG